MSQKTTVVIVDDHPVVRAGLGFLLAEQPDFEVVGEADGAETALGVIAGTRPEVVVLDLTLNGREAIPLIGEMHALCPDIRVLVLSMHDEMLYAERLLGVGARGYVMKQEAPAEFLRALRKVAAGEIYVSQAVSERLLSRTRHGRVAESAGDPLAMLTGRELDVLRLVARGLGTREIGSELGMSPKTVDSHRRNIREKLGLSNPRELVRYAVRWLGETENA
jgi:DNA-binding NarL/FixJ family response regulator